MGQGFLVGWHCIRKSLDRHSVSDDVKNLMMSSWAKGSIKSYATPIKRWLEFSNEYHIDPFNATFEQGAEFIAQHFHNTEVKYSVINTMRSALSTIIAPRNGISFGKSPIVTRMLRGVFKRRPSLPKYTMIYDVSVVLNFLSTITPNGDISLELLVHKLVALMCLLAGQRS